MCGPENVIPLFLLKSLKDPALSKNSQCQPLPHQTEESRSISAAGSYQEKNETYESESFTELFLRKLALFRRLKRTDVEHYTNSDFELLLISLLGDGRDFEAAFAGRLPLTHYVAAAAFHPRENGR